MRSPDESMAASNGDVLWVVPMGRPGNIPHAAFHHWSAGACLTTSIAHKEAVAGAKALAVSAIEFLMSLTKVDEAQRTFESEIAGTECRCLLRPDQKPPVDLNREMMDGFRRRWKPPTL